MKSHITLLALILCLCFVPTLNADTKFKKIIHQTDPDAKCLDGSAPAIYVSQGAQTDKILIYLFGGGYCEGENQNQVLESCLERSKTQLGGSKLWPQEVEGQGYLSANPSESKFANWTKFLITYCDGSLYQGFRTDPIKYKNTLLYFRGQKIVKSHLQYIQKNHKLSEASKVILTGSSAGGVGTYLWTNYLHSFLDEQKTQLYSIVDSGVFIDAAEYNTKNHLFATTIKNLYTVVNAEVSTPISACNNANPGNQWKCLLYQYNYKYILNTPLLFVSSEYDSFAIPFILKLKCLTNITDGNGYSLSKCPANELKAIQEYREQFQVLLFSAVNFNPKVSLWSIACSNHGYIPLKAFYEAENQRVPQYNGYSIRRAVQEFVLNNSRIQAVDLEQWPSNKPCAI